MISNKQIRLTCFISFLILFNILLFINFNLDHVSAQSSDKYLVVEKEFQLTEFSEHVGENINVDAINITMPSSSWNITSLEANFTDIKLGKEVLTVEEEATTFLRIYKSLKAYGVQLNITENIILFGVYIYGYLPDYPSSISDVWVQIKGYNGISHIPNSTQYGDSVLLNISSIPDWYLQEFPNPISLSKGQYYLVLNGAGFLPNDNSNYYWYLNEASIHNNLYTSKLISDIWDIQAQGEPFMHKLIQRTERSYDPEEINMSIGINGDTFLIANGDVPGTGTLNLEDINHFPNTTSLISQIHTNRSIDLLFNMTYKASYKIFLESSGSVRIEENKDNLWSVSPVITRKFENHTLYFNYPNNWNEIRVMRNSQDITSQVVINETLKYLFLPNETILDGATWLIQANSPNTNFNLVLPRLDFRAGQELKFSLEEPVKNGTYTFILYDSLGYELEDSMQIKQIPPGITVIFSYNLSSISNEGIYKAYIYWYDLHDAGIVTQDFNIIIPDVFDPSFLIGLLIISIVSILSGISVYVTVKKTHEKSKARKEAIFKKWQDITNLQYFMLIEKSGSLNVFEQVFTNRSIDPTLITGFLSAIRSFGIELTNSEDKTQTIKLEYKDSKILMSEFKHFRLIFIMGDVPSQYFLQSLADLSTDIEENYGNMLKNFVGNTKPFGGVEDLLKKHLKTSILYPLKISDKKGIKITNIEKTVILKASDIIKNQKKDYFYTTSLLSDRDIESKEIDAIIKLIDKGIFIPIL